MYRCGTALQRPDQPRGPGFHWRERWRAMGTPIRRGGRLSAPSRERATFLSPCTKTHVPHRHEQKPGGAPCGGVSSCRSAGLASQRSPAFGRGLRRARGGPHLAPAWVRPRRPRPARRPRGSRMPHRAAGRPGPLGAWRARPREPLTLAGKRGRSSCFYKFAHHRATTSHGQEASCGGVTWKSKGRPGAARGTTLKPTELSICI